MNEKRLCCFKYDYTVNISTTFHYFKREWDAQYRHEFRKQSLRNCLPLYHSLAYNSAERHKLVWFPVLHSVNIRQVPSCLHEGKAL